MLKNLKQTILLSSLLHDIGKFYQRADSGADYNNSQFLSQETKRMIDYLCPRSYGGYYSHHHVLWTYQFLFGDKIKAKIPLDNDSYTEFVNIASYHHRPRNIYDNIIQLSDWLSSGMDRTKIEPEQRVTTREDLYFLKPIFELVSISGSHSIDSGKFYNITPLSVSEEIKPCKIDTSRHRELCKNHWERFCDEFLALPNCDLKVFLESLLSLLRKYLWCLPASIHSIDDNYISLFDHLKTTAMLSQCVLEYFKDAGLLEKQRLEYQLMDQFRSSSDTLCYLMCLDISGIQDFIYQVSSSKAGVSLKGRSFFIQLLSDALSRFFIEKMELYQTNIIYSSGGNVFLLVPRSKIKLSREIQKDVNSYLLRAYNGRLYVNLGYVDLSFSDFFSKKIGEKWSKAIENTNINKKRKFHELLGEDSEFFKPGESVKNEICEFCGKDDEDIGLIDDVRVCPECKKFIEIGKRLRNFDFIVEVLSSKTFSGGIRPIDINDSASPTYFIESGEKLNTLLSKLSQTEHINVISVNDTSFIHEDHNRFAQSYKFYGGNKMVTLSDGKIASFDYLAGERDDYSLHFKRLGVIKMDVDNLGEIFKSGFKSSNGGIYNPTISKVSTLSFFLDWFFCGYVNRIAQGKNYIDIIYSGGDDLFIVGQWDQVIELGQEIYKEFKEYTNHHPDFNLSGGISLVPPKFPILRAAQIADEYEKMSKNHKIEIKGKEVRKNSITLFGKTVNWNDFMIASSMKDYLGEIVSKTNKGSEKAILSHLKRIHDSYMNEYNARKSKITSLAELEEVISYTRWRWLLIYDLYRFAERNKELADSIDYLVKALLNEEKTFNGKRSYYPIMYYLDIPVKWVDFLTREKGRS